MDLNEIEKTDSFYQDVKSVKLFIKSMMTVIFSISILVSLFVCKYHSRLD